MIKHECDVCLENAKDCFCAKHLEEHDQEIYDAAYKEGYEAGEIECNRSRQEKLNEPTE